MADPREDFRWENIRIVAPEVRESKVESLVTGLDQLGIGPKFSCSICGNGYSQEGYLKRHLEAKHGKKPDRGPECDECGKVFANSKTLEKHKKTHLKCKTCKADFETIEEPRNHQKEHTYCKICQKEFRFISKLTKHIESIHK
jgi:uncharacterized Zn-finger protein